MVKVTETAKQELKKQLLAYTNDPDLSIRLESKSPGELRLVLDRESEGDQVIEHEGTKVLLVAPELATALEGIALDVQDTTDGPKLVARKE